MSVNSRRNLYVIAGLLSAIVIAVLLAPQLILLFWFLAIFLIIIYVILNLLKELSQTSKSKALTKTQGTQ
ncbi:MAG: hypothetical protein QXT84_03975 [Candidatus Bathyarchaeia archaeon]